MIRHLFPAVQSYCSIHIPVPPQNGHGFNSSILIPPISVSPGTRRNGSGRRILAAIPLLCNPALAPIHRVSRPRRCHSGSSRNPIPWDCAHTTGQTGEAAFPVVSQTRTCCTRFAARQLCAKYHPGPGQSLHIFPEPTHANPAPAAKGLAD